MVPQCMLIILLILISSAYAQTYLSGSDYTLLHETAAAHAKGISSTFINPAGLSQGSKTSISASASNYSWTKISDETKGRVNSSNNSVVFAKSFTDLNFAIGILTGDFDFQDTQSVDTTLNSEGFPTIESSASIYSSDMQRYVLAFAPKDSHFGLSFNLFSLNYLIKNNYFYHNYSDTTPAARLVANTNSRVSYSIQTISLNLGYQRVFNKYSLGLSLFTPNLILKQSITQSTLGTIHKASGSPSAEYEVYNDNLELKAVSNTFSNFVLRFGNTYRINTKNIIALDFSFHLANDNSLTGPKGERYTWSSAGGFEASEAEGSFTLNEQKFYVSPQIGYSYKYREDLTYGIGMKYEPNTSKNEYYGEQYSYVMGLNYKTKSLHTFYNLNYLKGREFSRTREVTSFIFGSKFLL